MWFGARAASQRWTASTMTQTAQGNDRAEYRSRFCFGLVGWLEGAYRADGRVTVTGTGRKQFFVIRVSATKFFDFYFF
jgi:hypothetical protein